VTSEDDTAAWARLHRACFETTPLVEMRGGERIQVGFTVDLYAALPTERAPGAERRADALPILARLRAIAESLTPAEGRSTRVEIETPRDAVVRRPENVLEPEVSVRARIFHGDDYFAAVTDDERDRVSVVDRTLTALGLRSGHW
jgi:hypothetical protein